MQYRFTFYGQDGHFEEFILKDDGEKPVSDILHFIVDSFFHSEGPPVRTMVFTTLADISYSDDHNSV